MFTFLCVSLNAQENDIPYNLNRAYLNGLKGISIIKVTMTYDSGDYKATDYHYYDSNNLNFKTTCYYRDTFDGKFNFYFNNRNQLIREENLSNWISTWDSRYLDTTKAIWTTDYEYYSNGLCKNVINQWYNESGPESKTKVSYEYDNQKRIIKETEEYFDLDASQLNVYFEPNSTKISSNQNPPKNRTCKRIYKYLPNKTLIENYEGNKLKTNQVFQQVSQDKKIEILIGLERDTLNIKTILYNTKGQKISEQEKGDCGISIYGGYGDGADGSKNLITTTFDYDKSGVLIKRTIHNTKNNRKTFFDYEYIK
jgi:hypothetical protein